MDQIIQKRSFKQKVFYTYGWIFVRPRRWFFWRMVGSCYLIILPKKGVCNDIRWPNIHWWLLYKTVFRFFRWLNYDAWRPFCKWDKHRYLSSQPLIARIIQRIGQTTAGYAIHGLECHHCGSEKGDPIDLSSDNDENTFILEKTWTTATEDGTDHRFCGTTICPVCGYQSYYEDGSL